MRVAFLGSPPFATPVLARLLASRHRPLVVVTPPDRPRGRGRRLEPSPVAALAAEAGVDVLRPETARDPALRERLDALAPDVLLVASYGELLRDDLLAVARREALNVHPSLLPRWRGATPVQAALLAGDEETGVSIQRVVRELDAGDVLVALPARIEPEETAGELSERLAALGGEAAVRALDALADGTATFTPQDPARVTTCRRLTKESGWLDWTRPADELERHVRAMHPWPGARTRLPGGRVLGVLRARATQGADAPGRVLDAGRRLVVAAGENALELLEVVPEGKRPMDGDAYLRGARLEPGAELGGP